MIKKIALSPLVWLICCLFMLLTSARAETRYVTDQFEITLRSGASSRHAILRMIGSGTALTVLARDKDNDYTKVKTIGGTEGWVLNRYLMVEPVARDQLAKLSSQLTNTTAKDSMRIQARAIKQMLETESKRVAILVLENKKLASEIVGIKDIAANVLAVDKQNKIYRQRLTQIEAKMKMLSQENYELGHRKDRDWFVAGALVLFSGLLLGLIITRIRWRKRSQYDGF